MPQTINGKTYYKQDLNTFEEQMRELAPIEGLIKSGQYRDIGFDPVGEYRKGGALEDIVARIKGTPVFNPNIGPQVNYGQGFQPFTGQFTPPAKISSASFTPSTNIAGQVATPVSSPAYDISKLGGFAMTPEEMAGGAGGIKAYQERTSKLYAPTTGYEKTPEETKVQTLSERLQTIQDELSGKSTYKTSQEAIYGVAEKQAALRDLESQITTLKNEAAAIPLQAAGVGVTAGMLGAKQAEQQRQIAVRALTLNSLYETMKGNYLNAQAMADRAVEQKFAPLEAESAAKIANYNIIIKSPDYTLAEKRRAEQLKTIEDEKKTKQTESKDAMKEIIDLMSDPEFQTYAPPSIKKQLFDLSQKTNLTYQNVITANNLAGRYKIKPTTTTPTEIKSEIYDKAKLEAAQLFETDRQRNQDKMISPDLYVEMRQRVPASYRDDFDGAFGHLLSKESKARFGIAPSKTKLEEGETPSWVNE